FFMRKWRSRTIGLLFTAAVSVYSDQAFRVNAATPANSPAAPKPDNADTKPSEGTSVTTTDVSISDAGTVEIHVNDANLVEVLRMLSLQSQRNIIASN